MTGTLDASGTGALNFTNTGAVAYGSGNQTRTLVLTGNNTGANTPAPLIGDNGSGVAGLTKAGIGTWIVTNANTYSGGTTLSAGQLNINNATALGTGAFTIAAGSIDNTSGGDITLTNNNTQNWNGNFTYVGSANNLNLGTGAVTLGGNRYRYGYRQDADGRRRDRRRLQPRESGHWHARAFRRE